MSTPVRNDQSPYVCNTQQIHNMKSNINASEHIVFILMFRMPSRKSNQKKNSFHTLQLLFGPKKMGFNGQTGFFSHFLFSSTHSSLNRFSFFVVVSMPVDRALKLMLHKGKLSSESNGWNKKSALNKHTFLAYVETKTKSVMLKAESLYIYQSAKADVRVVASLYYVP